jgi:MSHA biogenesis protein MshK
MAGTVKTASSTFPTRPEKAASRLALFCGAALLLVALLALLGAGSASGAGAQDSGLPDPTRPPAALQPAAASAPSAAAAEAPLLQSVIISDGRRGAIISGQYVALGGRVGEARLTKVEPSGVVLRGAGGELTLPLFPDVRKQPAGVQQGMQQGTSPATDAQRRNPPASQVPPRRQEKQQ